MKESFLHYLWRYQKFQFTNLFTTSGDSLSIEQTGQPNDGAGPDFLSAQIRIGELLFVGSVEIHLKASAWYQHRHEEDPAYDNVILHLVWEHDLAVLNASGKPLPTLELQSYVSKESLGFYLQHFEKVHPHLPCTPFVTKFPAVLWSQWRARLYLERLEQRLGSIYERLAELENDWEALLFEKLARSFGLNRNGAAFEKMAQSFSFSVVRKIRTQAQDLEALFMGQLAMLDSNSTSLYGEVLQRQYKFLCHKYGLAPTLGTRVQYARLRPANFPTIRLSQLAQLYQTYPNLFEQFRAATHLNDLAFLSATGVSDYWQTHYSFNDPSVSLRRPQKRRLTADFRSLLIINAIVPLLYAHSQWTGIDRSEWLFQQMEALPLEKNNRVTTFKKLGFPLQNALDSQAVLQLYPNYCQRRQCLKCSLGFFIMKQSP